MFLKLICILSICHAVFGRTQIQIGAIFNNDQDENEIAFRTAVERANIQERNFEMVPIISYVDAEDSFLVEKAVCQLITQGVVAIFGPSSSTSGMVSAICSVLEIPHLIYDWIPEQTDTERIFSSMTINLYPDTVLLAKAYGDIIRSFSWRSYTVVYDSLEHLVQLQDVLQIHGPADNPIITQQLSEGPDYRPFLKNIKTSGETWIVLHCATDKLLPILRQANELKMLGEYQSIFLAPIDTHTVELDEIQFVQANITTARIMDPTNFDVKNVVYDWERYDKREGKVFRVLPNFVKSSMLLINDAVWTFAKGLNELGIVDNMSLPNVECRRNKAWPHGKQIYEFIKGRSEEAATGRIQFNEHGNRLAFSLTVLELSPTGFQEIAIWDPENGVGEIGGDVDYNAKRVEEKLQNKTFIITSRIGAPFLLERVPKDGDVLEGNARYEGYSLDLIDAIAKLLGFKYRFELTPDGKYGSYNKVTKQWDGLVRQLLDGNADLGICDLTITSGRRKAVDFSPPFMTLGISILYAKPENAPPDLFSFLSPFSLDVWIYMATAYLGVSLLLYALARMAPDDWENPHPCNPDPEEVENLWTIPNTTWLTMGSIMGQGCDILPKAASTRLVTGMWWFFALMMLNSYTANLAAFLTMSRMDASIESADDLAKQSKIKYGAVSGGSTMSFFRDSNFSTFQRMWAAMESARPSVFTKSNDEGVDRVLKGKGMYAYLMESTTLEYIIERNCELMQVGGWLDYKTYGIAMPFNSPYRKQISKAILKLGEGGQLAELKRKWWKEKHGGGKCSQASAENADTPELGVENVGGVFLVLGFGLLVSIIIGILEFLWNVRKVAIDEKVTPVEAFKLEALFAVQFWKTTKPVRTSSNGSESNISKRSSKSLGASETKSINTNGNQMSSALSLKSLKGDKGNKTELREIKQNTNL